MSWTGFQSLPLQQGDQYTCITVGFSQEHAQNSYMYEDTP